MIDLHLSSKLFVPKLYPLLFDYSHRQEIYMGSAGSSKSYFITQKLILRALNEKIRIAVCRRYGTTLRNSCFSLFKDILKKQKIYQYVKINESDMRIKFPNESEVIFLGLDDETKLLSLNNLSTVFVEEAQECGKDIVEQLNLRMRGEAENQQIILAFNPINKNHWLYDFVNNPPESFIYTHTTFLDNPFLPEDNRKAIEELKERNPQKWRIFGLGEWGIDTDGLVFTNQEKDVLNAQILAQKGYERRCGCDFGYIDPSTLIDSFYDRENKTIYVTQCWYKRGCQLDEVAQAIKDMGIERTKLFCDSAEPRTIDYLRRQYINAYACIKGQNSVEARISFLQNHKIIVDESCKDLIMELENFSYIKSKQTGEYEDGKYTHEFSHTIDALGYAYSDIYTKTKLRTIDKDVLGL